jgi:hypothetical protein
MLASTRTVLRFDTNVKVTWIAGNQCRGLQNAEPARQYIEKAYRLFVLRSYFLGLTAERLASREADDSAPVAALWRQGSEPGQRQAGWAAKKSSSRYPRTAMIAVGLGTPRMR